eukprot:CAMPEP_0114251890 /NCGR_PEP_ID=MMETSP0058-20121206/15525_1 /TAXON_ID=36894 /ORGANISM="Pyramimonas parkeae, CCMP726" /LENGTH=358 /DNA_ID=CAMNT_0001365749 /DNA_START=73 /DNA_END=1149 /DNA_ORIENTATION=-
MADFMSGMRDALAQFVRTQCARVAFDARCAWSSLLPPTSAPFALPSAEATTQHIFVSVCVFIFLYAIFFGIVRLVASFRSVVVDSGKNEKNKEEEAKESRGDESQKDKEAKKECFYGRADLYLSAIYYPVLAALAFSATIELAKEDLEGRWHRVLYSSYWFSILYIGGNMAHIPVTLLKSQPALYKVQMVCHHTLSIVCFMRTSYAGIGHFFVSLDGCCELCTFLLNNVFLMKELGLNQVQWLFALNGVLLWLSYIFLRILLFPAWLFIFFSDMNRQPELTSAHLTPMEVVLFPATNLVLLGLSVHWFMPITKGMFKAVTGSGDPLKDAPTNSPPTPPRAKASKQSNRSCSFDKEKEG